MKKALFFAAASCALLLPSAALAQEGFTPVRATFGDSEGYSNYGQCQRALMKARNDDRKSGSQGYTANDYNYYTSLNFECRQEEDGRYYIYQIDAQGGSGR